MHFDAILLPPRSAESIARGYWLDRTINEYLDNCLAECPDKLALTAIRVEAGDVRRFTYREMATLADRIAIGLSRLGVGRNDVVAMQLPNWWHFSLLYLACSRIGGRSQSVDADLPRARTLVHAQARRSKSSDRPQEIS
jgi:cyclohexanecarboxylate-CoA ligase